MIDFVLSLQSGEKSPTFLYTPQTPRAKQYAAINNLSSVNKNVNEINRHLVDSGFVVALNGVVIRF